MRHILIDLCELLREQKQVLERMLELSREEREIIINSEPDKLEPIIRLELKELSKLGAIEKKRVALHKNIAVEMNIQGESITVSKIAKNAKPNESEIIRALQVELMKLIDEHTAVNNENRELIKAHIEYSETMLDLMVGSEDPLNNMYGEDGSAMPDKKKTTGFFDGHA